MSIGNNAFNNCISLATIYLPTTLTSIGISTFNNCNKLISITIPITLSSIGDNSFSICSSLTSIYIPNSYDVNLLGYLPTTCSIIRIT